MKLIIFDFEVFKHDVLLGMYIVDNDDRSKKQLYQTWDKIEIKKLYQLFKDDIWIGHNNKFYDNHILEAILRDKDPYNISINIIRGNSKKSWINFPLNYFDLNEQVTVKLKITEAYFGKKIHMTGVDFDIDRPLTEEEKRSEAEYNKSDLDQTYENFLGLQKGFDLRLALMKEFNLDYKILNQSSSNISSLVLGVKKDMNKITPILPYQFPQLRIKNKEVWDWYINQKFETSSYEIDINGISHQGGIGGIHAAREKYFTQATKTKIIWYLDVSGYYNLLMILYDLFSRSMSKESKEFYTKLYYDQLKLKKIDPMKREIFKTILLAVFGATNNQHTEFYDPWHFRMITINGQLFLIDLLEKLDPYITLIQSNTDGIMIEFDVGILSKVEEIITEWETRTGFTLKREKLNKVFQRDVNNYVIEFEDGSITVKGEALKYSEVYENPFFGFGSFVSKEPLIISILLKDFLLYDKLPENNIDKYKDKLNLFQFICKKDSFHWLELETDNSREKIQEISRAFPSRSKEYSTIYKRKNDGKKVKIPILPRSVFIYNEDIREESVIKELQGKIDWDWYISRVYERAAEFID